MLVQDWYGHICTHTSMSKSRARNRVMHETSTEPKVTRWSGPLSLAVASTGFAEERPFSL